MSKVLGLDPADHFGFSIGTAGKIEQFGMKDIAKMATQMRCPKVAACYTWLRKLCKENEITALCAEDAAASFKGVAALKSHARYAAIIDLVCAQLEIERIDPVHPTKLKSWAAGSGKAQKPEMVRAARMLYGIDVTDPDAADAVHVCAWAMNQLKVKSNIYDRINW